MPEIRSEGSEGAKLKEEHCRQREQQMRGTKRSVCWTDRQKASVPRAK